ncbi:M14 family zinc carboxypeptidase [Glaciecola sp. 1036]|uniref:M14 family zinc carboxypeptidase n=1 Tax=Alteromonadaceae TaxID=72275 RepID=UPI003CFC718D
MDLKFLLKALNKPHLVFQDIQPLIKTLSSHSAVEVEAVGNSFSGKPIYLLSMGQGPTNVFLWTQMHGDEATATAAIFDLIDQLLNDNVLPDWQERYRLHILPMLNPDGAQRRTRQNAQAIDINRDSIKLQTPEGRLLKKLVKKLKPAIGFNLHDQSPYYQVGTSGNPSTIAFLAPAFDHEKTISAARARAMALIHHMNQALQPCIPNSVARYDDTYSPRSFGDYIASLDVSTILIESGAASGDPNRQIAREMNVKAIIEALKVFPAIETAESLDAEISDYFNIPENVSETISSVIIDKLHFICENSYQASISIKQTSRWSNEFYIDAVGDLGVQAGLAYFDASDLSYEPGMVHEINNYTRITNESYLDWLRQGVIQFQGEPGLIDNQSDYQILCNQPIPALPRALILGQPAYFLMRKAGKIVAAVINGRLVHL